MKENKKGRINHQEKASIISLITTLALSIPYLTYIFLNHEGTGLGATDEVTFYARAILLLIPIRIAAEIILYIVASILTTIVTQKEDSTVTDERDRLIALKSIRNAHYTQMIGFLIAMIILASGQGFIMMFKIFIPFTVLVEVTELSSKIFYYKRGY